MKKVRKISKKYYLRQIMACWLVSCMLCAIPVQVAMATVNGGAFTVGNGTIVQNVQHSTVEVNQLESVIEWGGIGGEGGGGWGGIDTGANESLKFSQISGLSNSAVLNRIMSGNTTQFDGELKGTDMRIFIVNPAGIVFGSSATINVSQLVASSLDIDNDDFINGLPYTFTGGANGEDVINRGTITAEAIALIGKRVYNRGTLVADDYVIMAAGETVVIQADPGVSNVAVVVSMPEQTPGSYDYIVDNGLGGDSGDGDIEADHVILAAGDIWSAAIDNVETLRAEAKGNVKFSGPISAFAVAASDAVADVTIISGGDLTINNPITAYAYANTGNPEDDAKSTIDIHADGTVNVNDRVYADAQTYNGSGNAEATINIDADESVDIDAVYDYPVEAFAKAKYGSGDALATVNLTADENVNVEDGVRAYARTKYEGSGNSKALVNIDAGDVDISDKVEAWATVKDNSGNAKADVMINTDYVNIAGGDSAALVKSWTRTSFDSGNATSKTTIVAGDDVNIEDGSIEAWAVTEDSSYSEGTGPNLDATVDIDTDEGVIVGDSLDDDDGKDDGHIMAVAKTGDYASGEVGDISATVDIDAGLVDVDYGNIGAVAKTGFESWVNAGDITATVNINAVGYGETDGDVLVGSYYYSDEGLGVELSPIEAHAEAGSGISGTSGDITAMVDIYAEDDVIVNGGGIEAKAKVGYQQWAQAGNLDADVIIEAKGDVDVDNGWIWAAAYVDKKSPADAGDATANVDIDAGGDVVVTADNEEAGIGATARDADNNTAGVLINADGDVDVVALWGYYADIYVEASYGFDNTAGVDITANEGRVLVSGDDGYAGIAAKAMWAENDNIANVTITAKGENGQESDNGNVKVIAKDGGEAWIDAVALDAGNSNSATTTINADGDVEVEAYNSWAGIGAYARVDDESNTAKITITAGGNVDVMAQWGEAEIYAEAREGDDNIATIDIDAVGGDVTVIDIGENGDTAKIKAIAEDALNSNTAEITINATATTSEYEEEGEVYVEVDGGNVLVEAKEGGHAEITAFAADAEAATNHVTNNHVGPLPEVDPTSNTANVTIRTTSAEGTRREIVKEAVKEGDRIIEPAVYGAVAYTDGGDVKVIAENGSEAAIQAVTMRANENDSDVLICADGSVLVKDESLINHSATIKAIAHFGNLNNAYTGVRGAEGIQVLADSGNASIASEAMFGLYVEMPAEQNTAFTSLCTDGDVLVIGLNNGTAEVLALADEGLVNNADVGVCADGDILVAAGLGTSGGTAKIKAEARAGEYYYYPVPVPVAGDGNGDYELIVTKATANVTVVSHKGGVGVIDVGGPTTALIEAEAYNGDENNAYVGIAAGADLSPADLVEPVTNNHVELSPIDQLLEYILPGNVNVEGRGSSSRAYIFAHAYDGYVNTAETVVCAPGEVLVLAENEGSETYILSQTKVDLADNSAATRIYASEVTVSPGAYIEAYGLKEAKSRTDYSLTTDGEVVDEGEATLIIRDYSKRENCPECPPCPDCEEEETPLVIAAALVQLPLDVPLIIKGCPVVIEAAANELGITPGTIQVSIGNALALNPTLQACDACATLIEAAAILRDEDGSRMAAMTQMFNDMAPSDAPYTPEMQALIATAFAGAAKGSQYATVMEYTDAFVQYFSVLETDLASPVGDSLAFVMDKYGTGVLGSDNSNIAAFIATRLESGETFGD